MSKNISRSKILEEKLIRATVNILKKHGGVMPYKDLAEEITRTVVFDEWELSFVGKNQHPRWYSRLQACSNDLVKAGDLIKSRGIWGLTNITSSLLDIEGFSSPRLLKTQYVSPKLSDEEWLNILSGKDSDFSDKRIVNQIKTLGLVIKEVDAENKKEAEELIKLESRLNKEGLFYVSAPAIKNKFLKLINKIKLIIIFAIGLIVGVMTPMELATRGESDGFIHKMLSKESRVTVSTHLKIHNNNPLNFSHDLINKALEDGLEISISGEGDYVITIQGFKAYKQLASRIEIGLPPEIEGSVEVIVTH